MKTISIKCNNCGVDFQKSIYYIRQAEKRGQKNYFCSIKCSCLSNHQKNSELFPKLREQKYLENPKICPNCSKTIPYNKKKNDYCSSHCSATFIQKDGGNCHWSDEGKHVLSIKNKQRWADGLYDNLRKRIDKNCLNCNKTFQIIPYEYLKNCCSKECSFNYIKKNNLWKNGKHGGYREKGGRGKQGWYKGYFCNSSWELAWVIYNLDNNIKFTRNTEGFEYEFEDKRYKYYPDFIMENGEYTEIKGYNSEKVRAKLKYFPHKLNYIGKDEIKPFIIYTKEKYGNDFIRLYEGNPHNQKLNKCLVCGNPAKNKFCSRSCSGKRQRHHSYFLPMSSMRGEDK